MALLSGGNSDRESAFLEATPDGATYSSSPRHVCCRRTRTRRSTSMTRANAPAHLHVWPRPKRGKYPVLRRKHVGRPNGHQAPGGPAGTAIDSGPGNIGVSSTPSPVQGVQAKKADKRPTRTQLLTRALKSCRKRYAHSRERRATCERVARRRLEPRRKAKRTTSKNAKTGRSPR